jgi:NTE family protein
MFGRTLPWSSTFVVAFAASFVTAGCAHYPVNQPLTEIGPGSGYRGKYMGTPGNSEDLLLYLTFSGGGHTTRSPLPS